MAFAPEVVAAIAVGAVVVIGLVLKRLRSTRTRNVGRPVADGPANLRFTCAGCSQQFTHSRRTLAAWRRGTRQFFCNACHTKWRGAQPRHQLPERKAQTTKPRNGPSVTPDPRSVRRRQDKAASGCLGILLIGVALPAALILAAIHYL